MSVVETVRDRLLGAEGVKMGEERVEPVPLTQAEIHELLSVDRRRLAIAYLVMDADGQCTLSDMAEYIAAVENGIDERELTGNQRKRVYVGLYQCHLPALDRAGVIDFDADRGTVTANAVAAELAKVDRVVSRVSSGVPA